MLLHKEATVCLVWSSGANSRSVFEREKVDKMVDSINIFQLNIYWIFQLFNITLL